MRSHLFVSLIVLWIAAGRTEGARVYYTDQPATGAGYVMSVAPDGTDQRTITIVSNAPDVRGIAFHRASDRVFFLDNGLAKKIYSLAPDGNDLREVTETSAGFNADLEIDEVSGKRLRCKRCIFFSRLQRCGSHRLA